MWKILFFSLFIPAIYLYTLTKGDDRGYNEVKEQKGV